MSTVWDRTAEFLSDNLAGLMPIVLLGLFMPLTLLGNLMPLMKNDGQIADVAIGVIVLLLSVMTIWGGIAITALAFDPPAGRAAAVATANRRLLPVLGISLLTTGIALLLALPIGVALAMSGIDMTALAAGQQPAPPTNPGAVSIAGIYVLLLIPVLLWAYARFVLLITPIMVMERRGVGVYARSFVLTRGIGWKVVGLVLLYGIVSWVASSAANAVFGSVFRLLIGGRGQSRSHPS
ncbi:hypothetical protein AB5I39_02920 [Sphingomonas sp. MMS24-J45]|uniref:hypothetical protein n=1 Tax=Sphingomonas sp. MMS24-J45 TaxID=3238806 RepID=UPI003850B2FA